IRLAVGGLRRHAQPSELEACAKFRRETAETDWLGCVRYGTGAAARLNLVSEVDRSCECLSICHVELPLSPEVELLAVFTLLPGETANAADGRQGQFVPRQISFERQPRYNAQRR